MIDLRAPVVVHVSHSVVPVQPAVRYPRRWFGLAPARGWAGPASVPDSAR